MADDPRVARTKALVLDAAGELLAEEGREGFTVDAVARRSGVARTTIYRHWPELDDLLLDAFRAMGHNPPDVDRGNLRDDLVALYTSLTGAFTGSCLGRAMPVLLDITRRDPSLQPLHQRFVAERRAPSLQAIARAVERGELPADVDADLLVDRLAGPIFYRHLVAQDPYSPADVERLVDDVLSGSLPLVAGARQPARRAPTGVSRRSTRAMPVGARAAERP